MRIIKTLRLKKAAAPFALFLIFIAACQPDTEILNSFDTQNVNSESASSALMNENADIAAKLIGSLTNSQYSGARILSEVIFSSDPRLANAAVTLYRTGTTIAPAGQIIIDFKTGCTDNHGIIRKGQIKIAYAGKRWMPGFRNKIKLIDFYRNNAHIEGVDSTNFISTGTNNDTLQLSFQSIVDSGKITFGDGRSVEHNGTLNKTWYRYIDINTGKIEPLKGELLLTGGGTGKNKLGQAYVWDITTPLVYSLPCWVNNKIYIPVKGEKTVTINNRTYTINYDDAAKDGACDNLVIVTLNGREKTILVTGDGN